MSDSFFEIKNSNFVASQNNKVENFNLQIKNQGDIVCLLGPSGVGKTTILRSIAGLQRLSEGEIVLDGKTISSKNLHVEPELRNVALSFQDNSLFPHYNVIDNINFGAKRNFNSKSNVKTSELIEIGRASCRERV